MLRLASRLCLALVLSAPALAHAEDTSCDRACLKGVLDSYFVALAAHDPSRLAVSNQVRFTQNSADLPLGQGLWQTAGAPTYRLDAIDPVSGQVAANAVVTDQGKPVILFVRLKVDNKKVSELETVVVRPGEGQMSKPEGLTAPSATFLAPVASNQRSPRAVMIAATNAYFDALAASGSAAYVAPPLADDMQRIENGIQTTGMSFNGAPPKTVLQQLKDGMGPPGMPAPGLRVSDRRQPVIDEESGIILAIGIMNLDLPPGMPDMPGLHEVSKQNRKQTLIEFFKITDGKVREIQATMYDLDTPDLQTTGWETAAPHVSASPAPPAMDMRPPPLPTVTGLQSYGLVVKDMDRAIRFYRDTLGLKVVTPPGRPAVDANLNEVMNTPGARTRFARLLLPNEAFALDLTEFSGIAQTSRQGNHNDPGASFLNIGFLDPMAVFDRLRTAHVTVITQSGIPTKIGPMAAVWVRDPDGHILEIMNAGWDIDRKSLFGVSGAYRAHFGVTMERHEQALSFYRDRLGFDLNDGFPPMVKAGDYMPAGPMAGFVGVPPQAQMTGVQGHCASTRCEMFEFKDAPRTPFRPAMQDPGAACLSIWVSDIDGLLSQLKADGAEVLTQGGAPVTVTSPQEAGWVPQGQRPPVHTVASREVLIRDPSGFPVLLMEPVLP